MPIVIPNKTHPLSDGRQSENAMLVRRGVQRLFLEMGLATLPELPLASGRRADLIAVSRKSEIWIVEIKSSIEDWKADRKWPDYRAFCDRLFCNASERAARNLSGRLRVHFIGWLWRGNSARCARTQALRRYTQSTDAALCKSRCCSSDDC